MIINGKEITVKDIKAVISELNDSDSLDTLIKKVIESEST